MARTKGKILDELPPIRRSKGGYDWDGCARQAVDNPGKAILVGEGMPRTRADAARLYKHEPFVSNKGTLSVSVRNSKLREDGRRYGDVYLIWTPNETKD